MLNRASTGKSSVICAIALLLGVNLWYYWAPLPDVDFSPKTPFAFVFQKNGDARLRTTGQTYWQQMALGERLFGKGEIRTLRSKLLLGLTGGASLEIMPNTLISVDPEQDILSVQLVRGQAVLRSESEVRLFVSSSGPTKYLYRHGEAIFTALGNQLSVQVNSGAVVAQTQSGSRVLNRGDSGRLTSTQFFIEESKITLIEPRQKDLLTLPPNRQMKVRWQNLGPSYNKIQFYSGSSPTQLKALPFERGRDDQELLVRLEPESLYWKVIASSSLAGVPSRESATFFTRFTELKAPVALSPNLAYTAVGNYGETEVDFIVDNPGALEDLILEISPSSNFHRNVQRVEIQNRLNHKIKVGSIGNLYWRVIGRSPAGGETIESRPSLFAIVERPPADLAWTKAQGLTVDWEVELESKSGQVNSQQLAQPIFKLDTKKVPTGVKGIRYRFSAVNQDILSLPWTTPKSDLIHLPIADNGFYYLQVIGEDPTKKQVRLLRNELLYISISRRDLASQNTL